MTRYPTTSRIPVLAAIAAAVAAPPAGTAAAQTSLRHHDIGALSAAIEEARRSPFHAGIAAADPVIFRPAGYQPVHPLQEAAQEAPGNRLSPRAVFLPTLTVTLLADVVGLVGFIGWGYGGSGARAVLAATAAVVVPGLYAGSITNRYAHSLLGSLLGAGGAALILTMDPNPLSVALVPLVHAVMTTAFALDDSGG